MSASNCVAPSDSAAGRTALDRRLEVRLLAADADPLAPAAHVRGEVGADRETGVEQERLGQPRRRRLAVRADDVDRAGTAPADRRARASSARIRSVPKPSAGHGREGLNPARRVRQRIARASRARRRPPRARRSRRTSRSRASSRPARSPSATRARSASTSPCPSLCRTDDRLEDPQRVAAELDPDAAAPVDARRGLRARRCASKSPSHACRLGPRRDDQPRLARRQVRPDLLGHVRHHRMEQLEEPLERRERRRAHVLLGEPRLDRLEVPVAEVVEREVVEPLDAVREVEGARGRPRTRRASRRCARGSSAPRPTTAARPARPRRPAAGAGSRSRACSRASAPPRSCRTRSDDPGVDVIFSSPYARRVGAVLARSARAGRCPVPSVLRHPPAVRVARIVEWMIDVLERHRPP